MSPRYSRLGTALGGTATMLLIGTVAHAASSSINLQFVSPEGDVQITTQNMKVDTEHTTCLIASPTDNLFRTSPTACYDISLENLQSTICGGSLRSIVVSPTDNDMADMSRYIVVSPTDNGGASASRQIVVSPTDNKDYSAERHIVASPTDNKGGVMNLWDTLQEELNAVGWMAPICGLEEINYEESLIASPTDNGTSNPWIIVSTNSMKVHYSAIVDASQLGQGKVTLSPQSTLTAEVAMAMVDMGVYPDEIDLDTLDEISSTLVFEKNATDIALDAAEEAVDLWSTDSCDSSDSLAGDFCSALY